ncbi:transcriptional regulator [Paracoccus sp. SM22M-07]|uniref:transcriptional regulator n=1 Tax=Paracoccus sp. SM22M-07 TaxID=1520813 RepID=UPI001F0A682E|nr:transcriptional regulator [Paracoccus sp. SM22M-07]
MAQPDAAHRAGVSVSTLKRAEGSIQPAASADAVAALRRAYEDAGVVFLDDEGQGPGVRLQAPEGGK